MDVFSKYGKCKIDLKKKYAFVDFEDYRAAERAIKTLHGTNLDSYNNQYKCNIEWSNKREKPVKIESSVEDTSNPHFDSCYICNQTGHYAK